MPLVSNVTDPQLPATIALAGHSPKFSVKLRPLIARFGNRRVSFCEILTATEERGYELLLVLITLPFVTPIPLPGLSISFGLAVALLGTQLALSNKPWLPQRLLQRELSASTLSKFLSAASRITQ